MSSESSVQRKNKKYQSVFNFSSPNLVRMESSFPLIISTIKISRSEVIYFLLLLVRPLQNNYFFGRIKLEE